MKCPCCYTFKPGTAPPASGSVGPPTDALPFPQPFENFSLTNYVELVKIDEIWKTKHNGFDMVRLQPHAQVIRHVVSARNIFKDTHDAYIAAFNQAPQTGLRLMPVFYTDILKRRSVYFFINKKIKKTRDELDRRCFAVWRTHAGADAQGSVYFPSNPNRFPYEMPSRGVVFR